MQSFISKRRSSSFNTARIDHLYQDPHDKKIRFHLHYGDLTDSANIIRLVKEIEPDEIYNLAAMSHVHVSFETPEYTAQTDAIGTLRVLEAIRILKMEKKIKFYQASSSEMFGNISERRRKLKERLVRCLGPVTFEKAYTVLQTRYRRCERGEESSDDDVDFTFPTEDATELMQFLHRDVNNLSNLEDN